MRTERRMPNRPPFSRPHGEDISLFICICFQGLHNSRMQRFRCQTYTTLVRQTY